MYPYIQLGSLNLYMTGIGIVVGIISFVFLLNFYSKRYNLNFWKIFSWLPVFLVLPYLLGGYFYYLLEYNLFFSFDPSYFLGILMPKSAGGYEFHFIGVALGLFAAVYLFLNSINIYIEKFKWIDVIFYSLSLSLVPLGFFLLLGETVYGAQTSSFLGISAFSSKSSMLSQGDKLYPVGIFLSLVGLVSFVLVFVLHYIFNKKYGLGFIGFVILLLGLNVVFITQSYSKHIPFKYGSITLDIKNYFTVFLSGVVLFYYFKILKTKGGGN